MLLTSDGRAFVYAVVLEDGCECGDLHSLYADEEAANEAAKRLADDPTLFGPEGRYGNFGKAHGGPIVECHEVCGQCGRLFSGDAS